MNLAILLALHLAWAVVPDPAITAPRPTWRTLSRIETKTRRRHYHG